MPAQLNTQGGDRAAWPIDRSMDELIDGLIQSMGWGYMLRRAAIGSSRRSRRPTSNGASNQGVCVTAFNSIAPFVDTYRVFDPFSGTQTLQGPPRHQERS